jgi:hypothetical protein
MLVDDLHTCAPDKLECKIVVRSDLTLKPDPIRQKDRYFNSVIAKVLQEYVLETWGALVGQFPAPDGGSLHQSTSMLSKKLGSGTHDLPHAEN